METKFVAALKFGGADVPNADSNGSQGGLGLEYRGHRASIVRRLQTRCGRNKRIWASFSKNSDYHNFNAPFFGNIGPDFTLSSGFEVRR